MLVDKTNFGLVLYNHAKFYRFEKTSYYWSVKRISVFLCFSLVNQRHTSGITVYNRTVTNIEDTVRSGHSCNSWIFFIFADSAGLLTKATFGNNALNANVYNTSSTGLASFLLTQQNNCYPIMMVSAVPAGAGKYSRLLLSRSQRDSLKYFDISLL